MKKFLFALRSIGLTIVGLVIAILVTTGLHSFFGLFLDPLPMVDLQAADWSGRSEIMTATWRQILLQSTACSSRMAWGLRWPCSFTRKPSLCPHGPHKRAENRLPVPSSCWPSGFGATYKTISMMCLWGCFGRPSTYWQQRHSPDWPLQLPEAYVNMKARKVLLPKMACTADNIGRP